jgi:hypothetical protein
MYHEHVYRSTIAGITKSLRWAKHVAQEGNNMYHRIILVRKDWKTANFNTEKDMSGWNEGTCNSEGVMKAADGEINLVPCSLSSFDLTVLKLPVLQPEPVDSWCNEQCYKSSKVGEPELNVKLLCS